MFKCKKIIWRASQRFLLKNQGASKHIPVFEEVTKQAGVAGEGFSKTFPTWFWDYNNDGWLDIFLGDFTFDMPIASYSAAEALDISTGTSGACKLYRNNQDGTFTNVSQDVGLVKKAFAMGANFGDIDNDGTSTFIWARVIPSWNRSFPISSSRTCEG